MLWWFQVNSKGAQACVYPFLGGAGGKAPTWHCRRHDPRVGKIPWRRTRQPSPGFLPGESREQRILVGHCPQRHKELDRTEATQQQQHSPRNSPPMQAATELGRVLCAIYSRSLLVIHFKYSSVYMSVPNSLAVFSSHLEGYTIRRNVLWRIGQEWLGMENNFTFYFQFFGLFDFFMLL